MAYEQYQDAGRCGGKILYQLNECGVPLTIVSRVGLGSSPLIKIDGDDFAVYRWLRDDTPVFKFLGNFRTYNESIRQPVPFDEISETFQRHLLMGYDFNIENEGRLDEYLMMLRTNPPGKWVLDYGHAVEHGQGKLFSPIFRIGAYNATSELQWSLKDVNNGREGSGEYYGMDQRAQMLRRLGVLIKRYYDTREKFRKGGEDETGRLILHPDQQPVQKKLAPVRMFSIRRAEKPFDVAGIGYHVN